MYKTLLLVLLSLCVGGCGVDWFPDAPVVVGTITFTAHNDVPPGTTQTSEAVTLSITGGDPSAPISVEGGEYSLNGGTFTSAPGKAHNKDTVAVRHTAASTQGTTVTTTLTVGDTVGKFTSKTTAATVTAFSFSPAALAGVTPASTQTSSAITVTLTGGTNSPISVTGGQYSIDNGTFTDAAGTVNNGQTVKVQHTAAASGATNPVVSTTLTIGDKSATFTTSTANVVAQTVTKSLPLNSSDLPVAAAVLTLKPGTYTVKFVSSSTSAGGYGFTEAEAAGGPSQLEQTHTFANGDSIFLFEIPSDTVGGVSTLVITIDGVPITYKLTTTAAP